MGILDKRFTMRATILKQGTYTPSLDLEEYGEWVSEQDWLTGEIIRVWKPFPDNPNTDVDENLTFGTIKCICRGIISSGIGMTGTNETFGLKYENIDYVRMWTPASVKISKRDRITNIRNKNGHIM